MAIAGRVAIVPKGEYSNAVTYDKLDLVMFNNDAYVAKKASTGIEPTNDEYWMLILNNVVAEDLENIINGTTPVGNANKLGGKSASEYALDADLANYLSKDGGDVYGTALFGNPGKAETMNFILRNNLAYRNFQTLADGSFRLYDARNSKVAFNISADGATNTWNGTASGNLPLSGGGTVNKSGDTPVILNSTTSGGSNVFIGFQNEGVEKGYIGFRGNVPSVSIKTSSGYTRGDILHTGNSAKVVVSSTAPTDTTSVWLDTANKKTKAYIDGAWTVIA